MLKITGISPVHLTRGWLWPRGGAPSGDLVVTIVMVVILVTIVIFRDCGDVDDCGMLMESEWISKTNAQMPVMTIT